MIVWGGKDENFFTLNTGGRYDPSTDNWTPTSATNAPSARVYHTAVWTGSEMIIWGGYDESSNTLNTGGRYNPGTDSWVPTSIASAPTSRAVHTVIWSGTEMIVWGGYSVDGGGDLNTGGKYNPVTDGWTSTSTANAPIARDLHTKIPE